MTQSVIQLFFKLIGSAITDNQIVATDKLSIDGKNLDQLLTISNRHDLTHMLVYSLDKNGLLPKDRQQLKNHIFKAIYRYELIKRDLDKLCDLLERSGYDFIPLKGAVLREYYCQPWMRTSCDIDVLVHLNDVESVAKYLIGCGFTREKGGSHDISLFTPNNVHVELHFDLVEEGRANNSSHVLSNIWIHALLKDGYNHLYEMTDEMFYFYHIAHMAKHFEIGGCGIRPFVDLFILDNLNIVDNSKRNELLQQGGLLKFTEVARQLNKVWFDSAVHSDLTSQLEEYIVRGGIYGSMQNRVVVQQQKKGGRVKYIIYKVFLPYNVIKFQYPILQKHPCLTPFMEIKRWFRILVRGIAKQSINELRYSNSITDSEADRTKEFIKNIGL